MSEDIVRNQVLEFYNHLCIHCLGKGNTVHELEPKSLAPLTWNTFENRVSLCIPCHAWAQQDTEVSKSILIADKMRMLKILGKTEPPTVFNMEPEILP